MYINEAQRPCTEQGDDCYNCKHNINCPLMQLLSTGFVNLNDPEGFFLENCQFKDIELTKKVASKKKRPFYLKRVK